MMDLQNKNIEDEENPFADDPMTPAVLPKIDLKVQSMYVEGKNS